VTDLRQPDAVRDQGEVVMRRPAAGGADNMADTHAPHGLHTAARHAMSHPAATVPFASQPALRAPIL
jgi:hypothetical protein